MPIFKTSARLWLLAIFVLSGFAGLIYQSIWSHYLGLFLGHAAYAQALVLAIFMGGMAVGAAWIAHAGQKWKNLIRIYAIIEATIGILGIFFHEIYLAIAGFSYNTLIPGIDSPFYINIVRWIIAAALILPQTILLGMTFPLMSSGLIRRFSGQNGKLLGGLYFTNSIGAAFGALIAVFVLLPIFGLPGSLATAGLINLLVALMAWLLSKEAEPQPPQENTTGIAVEHSITRNPLLRLVLFSTALSGAASFIYEIVWVRMLSMAVGTTMHAFELMLASFIAGIALGGYWIRNKADRAEFPLKMAGWMQVGMGVAALASLAVYANAFSWVGWLINALSKSDGAYTLFHAGTATISILIMLPAAFFAGTTLPLFTVTLLRSGLGERSIGRVYAWNTVGAILGVFAAIHVLIPFIGLKLALCVAALIDLAIGLILLRWQVQNSRQMLNFSFAAGLSAISLIVAVRIPYDPLTLASGVFRYGRSQMAENTKMLSYRDGKTASVSVFQAPDGITTISTNGKPDASINLRPGGKPTDDESTMVLLGALPLTIMDQPSNVAVIGFGSGLTTHTLLGDQRVKSVSTIEIEQAMIDGARAFGPRVARAFTDPRSHVILDDAKAHFAGEKNKFDLIVSEPSNPWISGVGSLFSKEFYQFIPKQLNKNGIFVQWVQLYEIDDEILGSIFRALTPAFSDYAAWISNRNDLIIIASPEGDVPAVDFSRINSSEALKSELKKIGIDSAENLNFRKVANKQLLEAAATAYANQPINSDYLPILSLYAPKTRFQSATASSAFSLPYINGNLLSAIGVREPLASNIQPSAATNFLADEATNRARTLALDLKNPSSFGRFHEVVFLKAMGTADCKSFTESIDARKHWANQARLVFEATQPFLDADSLKGVWIDPVWQRCKTIGPAFEKLFALLSSHARRDYASMDRLGREWLDDGPGKNDFYLKSEFDPIAISGLLLSLTREQRWNDVEDALIKYAGLIPEGSEYGYQRDLIAALAKNQKNPSNGR